MNTLYKQSFSDPCLLRVPRTPFANSTVATMGSLCSRRRSGDDAPPEAVHDDEAWTRHPILCTSPHRRPPGHDAWPDLISSQATEIWRPAVGGRCNVSSDEEIRPCTRLAACWRVHPEGDLQPDMKRMQTRNMTMGTATKVNSRNGVRMHISMRT